MGGSKREQIDSEVWTGPHQSVMPQPWRRSEIIEIIDSDESDDSGGELHFSRNSQQVAVQRKNASSLCEHVAPVSTMVTQHTTRSQSVGRAAGSSWQPHGFGPATPSSSRSGTLGKGKGEAEEATSISTPQAGGSSPSWQRANRLPLAPETRRPDDRCMFA
jgi:hypothetical protein